jgi:L-malate glycosyltransferase
MGMKVAIIIPRISQAGPVKVIQALVNSMLKNEEIHIKVFYLDKVVDPVVNMRVPVERLIPRKFSFGDYDIIHTNGIRPDLFAFINRKKIRYHISTIHNFVFDDLTSSYNKIISLVFGNIWLLLWLKADKLVCLSTAMRHYYEKWLSPSKLEVIFNGIAEIDSAFLCENDVTTAIETLRTRGLKIIGSVGTMSKIKGLDQLLYLIADMKEFALVTIGDGRELVELQHLAKRLNVSDRCFFCGFRSNAVNYFRYFDLFIMPSRSEGFGLALLEAVQQKVPVVCSDIDVFRELFNNEEVVFFKLDDIPSLSDALRTGLSKRDIKVNAAHSRYLNNYTASIMATKYCNLYKSA